MRRTVIAVSWLMFLPSVGLTAPPFSPVIERLARSASQNVAPDIRITFTKTTDHALNSPTERSALRDYRIVVRRFDGYRILKKPAWQVLARDPRDERLNLLFSGVVFMGRSHTEQVGLGPARSRTSISQRRTISIQEATPSW